MNTEKSVNKPEEHLRRGTTERMQSFNNKAQRQHCNRGRTSDTKLEPLKRSGFRPSHICAAVTLTPQRELYSSCNTD